MLLRHEAQHLREDNVQCARGLMFSLTKQRRVLTPDSAPAPILVYYTSFQEFTPTKKPSPSPWTRPNPPFMSRLSKRHMINLH